MRRPRVDRPAIATPAWDGFSLTWQGEVVKRLRGDATNQRCVLDAFQGAGWPPTIPDPLPHKCGCNAKKRRRDTVESLNGGQAQPRIHFHADGHAGIRWEGVPAGRSSTPGAG